MRCFVEVFRGVAELKKSTVRANAAASAAAAASPSSSFLAVSCTYMETPFFVTRRLRKSVRARGLKNIYVYTYIYICIYVCIYVYIRGAVVVRKPVRDKRQGGFGRGKLCGRERSRSGGLKV